MIDNGYLYAVDNKRLFINTCLGCSGECSYCYLPILGYSNKKAYEKIMSASEIIEYLDKSNYEYNKNTLITLGCFSECFDERNKNETIEIIKYFLEKGSQVQVSTKKKILKEDLVDIFPLIKYYGQFIIFISSSTISNHGIIEKNTEFPEIRFQTFNLLNELNIPVVLYIKPVLKDITIKDLNLYKQYIKKYGINIVVVGSIFTTNKALETVHFSDENKLFYNSIDDENLIVNELSKFARVFRRSTEVTNYYLNKK